MSDPLIVPCPADVWTKVAESVTSGQIDVQKSGPDAYLRTYRDTGETAPLNTDLTKALRFFDNFEIANSVNIDQYVMAVGAPGQVLASL